MDDSRFDRLTMALSPIDTRRGLLRLLAAVPVLSIPLAPLFGEEGEAKRQQQGKRQPHRGDHRQAATKQVDAAKKKKKKKCAQAGQTTSKKRKNCCAGLVKTGNVCTRPSPPPSPSCQPGGCPANHICAAGTCQPCTVTCSGSPAVCGNALQTALSGSASTIYVCPGRYQPLLAGGFEITSSKTVIGAGQGAGSATNTILDANNANRVLWVGAGPVVLEQLRVTDGNGGNLNGGGIDVVDGVTLRMTDCSVVGNTTDSNGGGIYVTPSSSPAPISILEMTRCTVSGNSATGGAGEGGGLWSAGTITLTDCLIEDNQANSAGGGIFIDAGTASLQGTTQIKDNKAGLGGGIFAQGSGTLTIAESCRVTNNTAALAGSPPPNGGGINNAGVTVTLQGADPSPIVVNNCHENCGGSASVPKCAPAPISCPA